MKSIEVKIMGSVKEMPFTTVGHWDETEDGRLVIFLVKMWDWRFMIAVLFHELIEWAITKNRGVTTKECDNFDALYEDQFESGRDKADEPGDDPVCPYYHGHQWGNQLERLIIFLLGASWKEYLKNCGEICGCEYKN